MIEYPYPGLRVRFSNKKYKHPLSGMYGTILVVGTINQAAMTEFEPGKEYYIDISPAE